MEQERQRNFPLIQLSQDVLYNGHRIIGGRRYLCVLYGNPEKGTEASTIIQAIPDDEESAPLPE